MERINRLFHIRGMHRRLVMFLVNRVLAGTDPRFFEMKRKLLNSAGFSIGEGTRIVGPIECSGQMTVGCDCWIGKNLIVNGNGSVVIGDRCDIAPEVTFQTGGHEIGSAQRRAGKGIEFSQRVGSGVWIGGRTTILGNTVIGDSSVVAACACVTRDVEPNVLVGGVPARMIRRLENED